jgi:signal transduction histidine kinase
MTKYIGKILVIDDSEVNRYVLSHMLKRSGYMVIQAEDGKSGMALLSELPDIAIIDVNLPDITGIEIARKIKSNPTTAATMVLNISASHTRTKDRVLALESGADGYLLQPVDPQEFLATVSSLFRIRSAEETTKRSNRELESFAFVTSHDLQEPLRMVTGYLGLLKLRYGDKLDATAREYIRFAFDGAKRMSGMVNDLLSLSQMELTDLVKNLSDSSRLFQNALDNLELLVKESRAVVIISDLPKITADGGLITQVFQHLLLNAIKFRSERLLEIRVSATREHDKIVFSIEDNGIGIADEDLDRIFNIFQRLRSDICSGSGIGLSLCKRIIERHRGEIGVRSKVGVGTCFWFSLPA